MSLEPAYVKETPPGNASATQGGRLTATIRYVDRVDVPEVFADSITNILVDAQLMRVEFAVTRLDEMKANSPITGRRYPACRIVLSPTAALDLMNRLRQISAAFAQASKPAPAPEAQPMPPAYNGPSIFDQDWAHE